MSNGLRNILILLVVAALVPATWLVVARTGEEPVSRPSPTIAATSGSPTPLASPTPSVHFAKDACVSFPPVSGPSRGVVFLDPGHGGREPGAIGKTSDGSRVTEASATLAIVKVATQAFREEGYKVVVSRWADTTVHVLTSEGVKGNGLTPLGVRRDLLARAACANAAEADVLLSVHLNAFSDPDVGGTSMIYNNERTFSAANRKLAELLQSGVLDEFRTGGWTVSDRKVMEDTQNPGGALTEQGARYGHSIIIGHYEKDWVENPSMMPGVIMEPLFLTRPEEADIATTQRGQRALARAMVAAVRRFLGGA